MRLSEIEKELENSDKLDLPVYKVALLADYTIDPLIPYLRYECLKESLNCQVYLGEYNNIVQELEGSKYKEFNPDCTLIGYYKHNPYRDSLVALLEINKRDVDLNKLVFKIGYNNSVSDRMWKHAKIPYTEEAFEEIAKECMKYIRNFTGKVRKCIVLDCDNVLWTGILGEDGFNKIEVNTDFQQVLKYYRDQGTLLAICSKNEWRDVEEVFLKHPDMVLRDTDIAYSVIRWEDKVKGIEDIAKELNLGLDSLVFIDDSAFETNLVRKVLPQVTCIELNPSVPETFSSILINSRLFDKLTVTEEDKNRTRMYQEESKRKEVQRSMSVEDYLKWLEMEVTIGIATDFEIPRIAQMTQRTNQFNLTTKRYTEEDIKRFIYAGADVLWCSLKDRFGDLGIVGCAILTYTVDTAWIDSFMLSCRALGREVEAVLLEQCEELVGKWNKTWIVGEYIPTDRNQQTENFYPDSGYTDKGNNLFTKHIDPSLLATLESPFKKVSIGW